MSRFMRQVVVAVLVLSLLNLQSSASTIGLPPAPPMRSSLTAPLTEWASLAAWHIGRFFRSVLHPQSNPNLETLRLTTPNLPDPPNGPNTLPTTSYDDPKPTSTGYFNNYLTEQTQAANASGIAGSKPLQSTDPTAGDCSVGGFSYNLDSRNYNFIAPVLALGGRAGLNLSFGMSYNSKVWTGYQVNTYNRQLAFNLDKGFPGPGWRIGFGAIQGVNNSGNIGPYTNSVTGKQSLIYLTPDGTRHDLAYNSVSGLYESYDSSYLDFNLTTKVLRTTGGTQVTFAEAATASGDYQFLPTQIKDRNGNFLTIVYKTLLNNDRAIDYVLDTLSRRIDFYYENNRLREIRQDRNGTIFKYAVIDYAPVTLNVSL